MRYLVLLILFHGSVSSQINEADASEVFDELLTTHNQLDSYFAVYEGTAPSGKSINAVVAYHKEGNLSAVQAQFLANGIIVAAPLQVTMPQLGIVINGGSTAHLHDAHVIIEKLLEVFSSLQLDDENPLGSWSPALSLSKETASAQLTISAIPQVPWLHDELPNNTTYVESDKHITFTTPDNATYEIQSETGILQRQNYPNEQGDRTLILKELEIGLSEIEITTFISQLIPSGLPKVSFRKHTLFTHVQTSVLQRLVDLVDSKTITPQQVKESLQEFSSEIEDYLTFIYPDAPSMVATTANWKSVIEESLDMDAQEQMKFITQKISTHWEIDSTLNASLLQPQSEAGKKTTIILATEIRDRFLTVATHKALSDYPAVKK